MILGIKIEKIIRGESIIEDQRGYLEEKLVRKEERGSKERLCNKGTEASSPNDQCQRSARETAMTWRKRQPQRSQRVHLRKASKNKSLKSGQLGYSPSFCNAS